MSNYLGAPIAGGVREFEATVGNRRLFHHRSNELKETVSAVNAYVQQASAPTLRRIVDAICAWQAAHAEEFQRRLEQPIWTNFRNEIMTHAARYPGMLVVLDSTPSPLSQGDALNWVRQVLHSLDDFSTWVCLDAATFSQCIAGDRSENGPVRTRLRDWDSKDFRPYGTNSGFALRLANNITWNQRKCDMVYEQTKNLGGKGAVCTTFGYAAASVLTRGRDGGPRIELVSYPHGRFSHVYLLVGRRGGLTADNKIPDNSDAVVVDAWACSLGYPCVYENRRASRYPYPRMTTGLELIMQRPAS